MPLKPASGRLGELLRSWRTQRDLTLEEMGSRLDVKVSTLSGIERGRLPDAANMLKILRWMLEA